MHVGTTPAPGEPRSQPLPGEERLVPELVALTPVPAADDAAGAAAGERPGLSARTSALEAGRRLLQDELARWSAHRSAVLAGGDREALHRLRVSGRRLIAVLRSLECAPLRQALPLRRRLTGLVRVCGAARDLDVQRAEIEALRPEPAAPELQPLLAKLDRRREREQARLQKVLAAPRAARLFAALDALAQPLPAEPSSRPLACVAEELLTQRYKRLRRAARRVDRQPSREHCHALRLEAKKLRYLSELLVPLYGRPLRRYLERLQELQTLLGRINDSHHAIATLELEAGHAGRVLPAAVVFAMGRAAGQHQARLRAAGEHVAVACRRTSGRRWRRLRAEAGAVNSAVPMPAI